MIDNQITDKTKAKLLKLQNYKKFAIEFLPIRDISPLNLPPNIMPHINQTTNYRLMLSSMKPEIKKCILSDADLVYVADIKELWNTDVEDFYMAAVPDPADKNRTKNWIRQLPIYKKEHYVNTGVTVLNLEKWRQDNIESRFFTYAGLYHRYLTFPDQDLINIVLHFRVKYLNPRFNAMPEQKYYSLSEQISAFYEPAVIHWAGPDKPWQNPDTPQPQYFWDYVNLSPFSAQIYADYYLPKISTVLKKYLDCPTKQKKSPLYDKLCRFIP
ncbi:MAG: glycosyltransferase family 8 protein [Alphaproteobacteria bacterium]|nr:glycosyltransferase family 8 protein [Alphaproteobacteria bacterium]